MCCLIRSPASSQSCTLWPVTRRPIQASSKACSGLRLILELHLFSCYTFLSGSIAFNSGESFGTRVLDACRLLLEAHRKISHKIFYMPSAAGHGPCEPWQQVVVFNSFFCHMATVNLLLISHLFRASAYSRFVHQGNKLYFAMLLWQFLSLMLLLFTSSYLSFLLLLWWFEFFYPDTTKRDIHKLIL